MAYIYIIVFSLGAPLTYLYFTYGGGGDLLGSENLAKRDFCGVVNDAGNFWFTKKTQGPFFGLLYFLSAQINNNKRNLLLVWDFLGMIKCRHFWGIRILKLEFFWV